MRTHRFLLSGWRPHHSLAALLCLFLAACCSTLSLTGPDSQTVAAGQVATFTVLATTSLTPADVQKCQSEKKQAGQFGGDTGSSVDCSKIGVLTYQWNKNGKPVKGAHGASYSFVASAADNGAKFSVVVSDGLSTEESDCAKLTVTAAPSVALVAGNIGGPGNLNGMGTASRFYGSTSVVQDSAGNYFVADTFNQLIRKITPAGAVSNFAGIYAVAGHVDGSAATAEFSSPISLAIDSANNLYVADTMNNAIRKITPAGVVSTVAGSGTVGCADGTGTAATFAYPQGVAVDAAGNLYVADSLCAAIRKITPAGAVTTLATGLPEEVFSIAVNSSGTTAYFDGGEQVFRLDIPASGLGTVTTLAGSPYVVGHADGAGSAASFNQPMGLVLDTAGNLYVAEEFNCTIRKITPAGVVSTLAGSPEALGDVDGSGSNARFFAPTGIFLDAGGNLVVAEVYGDVIRKVSTGGTVTTFAGLGETVGYTDGTGSAATFDFLRGGDVVADSSGNLYVTDTGNSLIRKVAPGGVVTTLAGSPFLQGLTLYPSPHNGSSSMTDGTGAGATFFLPAGIAVDAGGNVYVADTGNDGIRKVTPAGVVTTLAGGNYGSQDGTGSAAQFNVPTGIAVDASGNLFVADYANDTIRKVTQAGVVTTFAGSAGQAGSTDGTGTAARFSGPAHLVFDGSGNLFVTDTNNETIRKITPAGVVTTVAGAVGVAGTADGTGSAANFNLHPVSLLMLAISGAGITIDSANNLYVADTYNGTVRKITSAGVVTTLAGIGGQVGTQLGTSSQTLGPTMGVAFSGNTVYTTVQGSALLGVNVP